MAGPPVIKGITTIRWGTSTPNSVFVANTAFTNITSAIVKKVAFKRLGGAPILIEDNNGFTAILVGLIDGDELSLTLIDDTSITWPAKYDIISMKVPNQANAKNFIVTDEGMDLERKREGEKTLTVSWFTNNIV